LKIWALGTRLTSLAAPDQSSAPRGSIRW
jgi:hypothetical protein